MILHTINKSPAHQAFHSCLRLATQDSLILLIEDGVYGAVADLKTEQGPLLNRPVYALQEDVRARGLSEKLSPFVSLIDYAGFVRLVEQCDTSQSWY